MYMKETTGLCGYTEAITEIITSNHAEVGRLSFFNVFFFLLEGGCKLTPET